MTLVGVVGAGVSGLTCAVSLLEAGYQARVIAAEPATRTTSMMAAAVWTIPGTGPESRSFRWSLRSREIFAKLSHDPSTGVTPLVQRELEVEAKAPLGWEEDFPWIRMLKQDELPPGYASGWRIEGFLIDPRRYLPWLESRLLTLGGSIEIRRLSHLEEVEGDMVINCSGLGAIVLCGDDQMQPVRGQVAVVQIDGITEAVSDEHDSGRISYIYPRPDEVILGGTREAGSADLEPDPATTKRILADTLVLVPTLVDARFVESRVGIRPGRHEVRLEVEKLPDGRHVIHNYGHGGQGFLLSWGCASDVLANVLSRTRIP